YYYYLFNYYCDELFLQRLPRLLYPAKSLLLIHTSLVSVQFFKLLACSSFSSPLRRISFSSSLSSQPLPSSRLLLGFPLFFFLHPPFFLRDWDCDCDNHPLVAHHHHHYSHHFHHFHHYYQLPPPIDQLYHQTTTTNHRTQTQPKKNPPPSFPPCPSFSPPVFGLPNELSPNPGSTPWINPNPLIP
ncbi:hypothetical protein ASPCADRAFT_168933, partial [Aspergillus carbonarius ITEM 5010]